MLCFDITHRVTVYAIYPQLYAGFDDCVKEQNIICPVNLSPLQVSVAEAPFVNFSAKEIFHFSKIFNRFFESLLYIIWYELAKRRPCFYNSKIGKVTEQRILICNHSTGWLPPWIFTDLHRSALLPNEPLYKSAAAKMQYYSRKNKM